MRKAEIRTYKSGAAISFPIEFKTIFKEHFPSAKWKPETKEWHVSTRAAVHLKQFEEAVNKAIEIRLEREERILAVKEIEKLEFKLKKVASEYNSFEKEVEGLAAAREQIAAARIELAARQDQLAAIKAERRAAAEMVRAERESVHAIVSSVVDVDEIERARSEMRKVMKVPKAWASEQYLDAETRLRDLYAELKKAGIASEAIASALRANKNRPDRDFRLLELDLDFSVT
ncbi:hypothetical protein [Thioclava sp. F28-4]|uniref:hypothetical protein n=1 Tax=Thioclava sp. F28-4 TaxID=1915315 RepID=UPI000997A849|nr:hypothetical protein [Thioclava sp. F28-4]OOY04597.1 hypothetical protein BMI87_10270 [Thioclava sp. F28-4]